METIYYAETLVVTHEATTRDNPEYCADTNLSHYYGPRLPLSNAYSNFTFVSPSASLSTFFYFLSHIHSCVPFPSFDIDFPTIFSCLLNGKLQKNALITFAMSVRL